ncbi:unnamed protein product [Ilex paraguariensis]|uniref:Myb/SANT-like DNA-binding domain-containing protein n=1 Tax=Ilex paraguariensis TaxID=185542 RepID=A0ABC8S9Z0_9AQUA
MSEQYGLTDLTELMAGRIRFPATPPASEYYRNLTPPLPPPPQLYETVMLGCHSGGSSEFGLQTTTASASVTVSGSGMESFDDGGQSRWPRQETLTLLEIRSRLDHQFKEANHKGHLWNEVSSVSVTTDHRQRCFARLGPIDFPLISQQMDDLPLIICWCCSYKLAILLKGAVAIHWFLVMREEFGYQRSGRKCKEKFENLYKYYKKTKEGKAGRQDGKNYRFFRQLEALYRETSKQTSNSETPLLQHNLPYKIPNDFMINEVNQEAWEDQRLCESLNPSNSNPFEFETSSSENNGCDRSTVAYMMNEKTKGNENHSLGTVRKSWKAEVKDLVGSHMRKLSETQEAWMEKMWRNIEEKEKERTIKEEEWRREEAARFDHEYEFWANDRARFEARNIALMESLQKLAKEKRKWRCQRS